MSESATRETGKPVRYLKGIGPKKSELLQKLGIKTVRDLCFFYPRRYEDRSCFRAIAKAMPGETANIVVANILKPVLIENAQSLVNRLEPQGGILIFSGLLSHEVQNVRGVVEPMLASRAHPMRLSEFEKGEWRALLWR